jgi:O-antigen ligase
MLGVTSNRTGRSRRGAANWLIRLQHTPFNTPFGIVALILGGLGCGVVLVALGTTIAFAATAMIACLAIVTVLVVLDQLELLAVICAAASLLLDWYQAVSLPVHLPVTAAVLALGLIAILFLMQSRARPWRPLPYMWAWGVFVLVMLATLLRSPDLTQALAYFDNIVILPLLMWILGVQLGRTVAHLRKLMSLLTAFGALIALHATVEALTGKFLFATAAIQNGLTAKGAYFGVAGTSIVRSGSFLGNPNSAGEFFTVLFFVAITAALSSTTTRSKLLHGVAAALILLGTFFSYSTTSWIATVGGVLVLIVLIGSTKIRLVCGAALLGVPALLWIVFPTRMAALLSHTLHPTGLRGRFEAWQTALNVIHARPFTGIGLGVGTAYVRGVAPYRANPALVPLTHPQDSFLEFAVLGGLPLLIAFLLLLGAAVRRIWKNYRASSHGQRIVMSGVLAIVVAVSINALGDAAWTLPPLVGILWLILGAGSSVRPGRSAVIGVEESDELPDLAGEHAERTYG